MKLYLSLLPISAAILLVQSAQSQTIPRVSEVDRPATTVKEWLAQSEAPTASVRVTGVRLNPIDSGIQVILQTAEGRSLVPEFTTEGNAKVAEIPGVVLALPNGSSFEATAPVPGITNVSVTQLEGDRIRIRAIGETTVPVVTVQSEVNPVAAAPEEPEEEVIVTGDRRTPYRLPNASTATGTDAPILETPFSVQVVPQEVLRDQQVIRLEDALTNISGVISAGTNGGREGSFSIRGFGNQFSGSVPTLRDGYRLYGNFQGITEVANLDKIEVLKGPASILYGEIEPGGVINLVSKKPLLKPFHELELQIGNRGLVRPRLDLTGPLTTDGNLLYRLNALYQHDRSFRNFNTDTHRFAIAPALAWKISDRTDLSVNLDYLNEEKAADFGITRFGDRVAPVGRDFVAGNPDDSITTRYLSTGYNLEHRFNDNWKLRNGFRYIDYSYDYSVIALPFLVVDADIIRFFADQEGKERSYSLSTSVVGKFATGSIKHTLSTGIDLNRSESRITTLFGDPTPLNIFAPDYNLIPKPDRATLPLFADTRTTSNRLGIYLQDQIYLLNNLILVAGLRYDTITQTVNNVETIFTAGSDVEQTDDALTPRVGLLYRPLPQLALFANYSRSFRPSASLTASGSPLRPEKGAGFEVGIKTELLDQRLLATLTYFDITKTNVGVTDPTNPLFSVALGEQKSRGIELDITGELAPGWKLISSYAYIDAKVSNDSDETVVGNRLFGIPRHKASLWTTYEIQTGRFKGLGFGAGLEYVSNRYGDLANSFTVGDYLIGNAAIYYRRDNYRLAVNIRNLSNANYIRSLTGNEGGIEPGEPLTVVGSFSVQF